MIPYYIKELTDEQLLHFTDVLFCAKYIDGGTDDEEVCNFVEKYYGKDAYLDKLNNDIDTEIYRRRLWERRSNG